MNSRLNLIALPSVLSVSSILVSLVDAGAEAPAVDLGLVCDVITSLEAETRNFWNRNL